MYYLLYGVLYLFSLLPWKVLYAISDAAYLLLYYIIRYRRGVVAGNLLIAFPERSAGERTAIGKEFYRNFLDTFIETLKFLSLSDKEFGKRLTGNFELISSVYATGQNVHLHGGHFFNWEYMNWGVPRNTPYTFIGVYAPLTNKPIDRIILKMRQRYKTVMVSVTDFQHTFHRLSKSRYALGLYADQNPRNIYQSYWLPFFGKLAPFVTGPEKSARINNAAIIFAHHYRVKRGHYHVDFTLVTTAPRDTKRGELTRLYLEWLQACIRKKPANYLWSHRRWKWEFPEECRKMIIS